MTSDHTDPVAEVIDCARAAEDAIRQLCRLTINRPSMTPADVDVVLAHLAGAFASLPQAAGQLGDILGHAKDDYVLSTDSLVPAQDAHLVIDTARLHLDQVRDPATTAYRHLDAAHNQAAHVVAQQLTGQDSRWVRDVPSSAVRRAKSQPPPTLGAERGPDLPR